MNESQKEFYSVTLPLNFGNCDFGSCGKLAVKCALEVLAICSELDENELFPTSFFIIAIYDCIPYLLHYMHFDLNLSNLDVKYVNLVNSTLCSCCRLLPPLLLFSYQVFVLRLKFCRKLRLLLRSHVAGRQHRKFLKFHRLYRSILLRVVMTLHFL